MYRTPGWIGDLRISRKGDRLAFFDHPVRHDTAGDLKLLENGGRSRTLASGWDDAGGLAWHPVTGEVWFTAARRGSAKSLYAVTTDGKVRSIAHVPGILSLRDISPDGRVLVTRDTWRLEISAWFAG